MEIASLGSIDGPSSKIEGAEEMKRFALTLIAISLMTATGFGTHSFRAAADPPACCQTKQNCCPKGGCCSGGEHSQCPIPAHHS
jgi:hypothetical protein